MTQTDLETSAYPPPLRGSNKNKQLLHTFHHINKQKVIENNRLCLPPTFSNNKSTDTSQLIVSVLNVAGSTKSLHFSQVPAALLAAKELDILLLSDIRATPKNQDWMKNSIKKGCPKNTSVSIFPTTSGNIPGQIHNDIGGLAIILSSRMKTIKRLFDPSGLALAGGVLIQLTPSTKMLIIVTYWPTISTASEPNNTLWYRAEQYLQKEEIYSVRTTTLSTMDHKRPSTRMAGITWRRFQRWIPTGRRHTWRLLQLGTLTTPTSTSSRIWPQIRHTANLYV
jgi:hypothetical protein